MIRRRRPRHLNAEERALWHHVVRAVTPLRPRPPEATPTPPVAPEPAPETPPVPAAAAPLALQRNAAPKPPPLTPLAPLEPKVRRRLGRGAEVDARIDLHGLTQAAAHRRLQLFLLEAQARGHGLVLVITGKGSPGTGAGGPLMSGISERGVLRRAVPIWLCEPALRPFVVGFETAARPHGGDGALYVRIRRKRGGPQP